MKKIIIYLWGVYPIIFIRKVVNTFRLTIWFSAKFYDVEKRVDQDASVWMCESHYKSDYYLNLGDKEQYFIDYVVYHTHVNDTIVDICCNQGRFLLDLKERGYSSLYGFDVMSAAVDKLKINHEYDSEIIHVENILAQEYFRTKRDYMFDWAITYTATIELINPEFDIFSELSRTVKKGMFLVINETGHTYPRFYRLLHRINGFRIISVISLSAKTVLIHSVKRQ